MTHEIVQKRKKRLVRIGAGLVVAGGLAVVGWSIFRPRMVDPPVDLRLYTEIGENDTELVGDWGNGSLTPIRAIHFLTGSVAASSTNPTDLRFYQHLVFGNLLDNLREKQNCNFRVRLNWTPCRIGRLEDLILVLATHADKKILRFERMGAGAASQPFILVDEFRSPVVPGLSELRMDLSDRDGFSYTLLRRKPTCGIPGPTP
jgi:hypothetical protein